MQAISISASLAPTLQAAGHAWVHSIFARTVNLVVGEDQLLTLACASLGDAPDTVIVDAPRWEGSGVAPGTRVNLSPQRIELGAAAAEVRLQGARPWRCRLPAWTAGSARPREHLPLAREHLLQYGCGFASVPAPRSNSRSTIEAVVAATLRHLADGLCDAVIHDDALRARQHIAALIGLGPGLTPSGDDFVLGWLLAMNLAEGPCQRWSTVGAEALRSAISGTHLISAAALRHVAEGRARQQLVGLCEALLQGDEADVRAALGDVIGIGASSGSDIAWGLLRGLELQLRSEPSPRTAAE